jgi:tight adherence protein C
MSTTDAWPLAGMLRLLCWAISAASFAPLARWLQYVEALHPPRLGERGRRRAAARESGAFTALEPMLAWLGARIRAVARPSLLASADRALRAASYAGGLWPEELLAGCILAAIAGTVVAGLLGVAPLGRVLALAIGAWLPFLRLGELARSRAKALERGLPAAMDLCVLCMGAGADFPAALRFAAHELGAAYPVCAEELSMVLEELVLGRTRVAALGPRGERTTSIAVRDFVAAVCQSEQKGTPVGDALSLQASALRQKRSVRAEELAAKTAVRLTVPLMMTLVCVMLLLFGPFIVRGGL